MEVNDGTRHRQGRSRQEGQAQEDPTLTPIFDELAFGRNIGGAVTDDTVCQICHLPDGAAHSMKQHKFTSPDEQIDTRQFDRRRPRTISPRETLAQGILPPERTPQASPMRSAPTPLDPVLRMALIDAGIITVEQLDAAEKKIRAFTQQVTETGPVYRGNE